VLLKGAVLLALALVAGCGSSMATDKREPGTRHLVYEKLIGEQGEQGVWIADVDGSNPRLLVAGGWSPSISPDGRWVAYERYCDGSSVDCNKTFIVSTQPSAKARLLMAGRDGRPIWWSADSTRIVTAVSRDTEKDELVSVDVSSGKETTLASGWFWGWSVSPDGKKVVVALAHEENSENNVFPRIDLYVTDVDGRTDPKAITATGDSAYPVWGPKSIAFSNLIPVSKTIAEFARNEIWRIQPDDGTGRTRITGQFPERLLKGHPHWHCIGLQPIDWSDDGSVLLAQMTCEGFGQTVAVDPKTGAIRSLGEVTDTVALSRDAHFALVQWGDGRVGVENEKVLIYPYAGGKPDIVATGAAAPTWNR